MIAATSRRQGDVDNPVTPARVSSQDGSSFEQHPMRKDSKVSDLNVAR